MPIGGGLARRMWSCAVRHQALAAPSSSVVSRRVIPFSSSSSSSSGGGGFPRSSSSPPSGRPCNKANGGGGGAGNNGSGAAMCHATSAAEPEPRTNAVSGSLFELRVYDLEEAMEKLHFQQPSAPLGFVWTPQDKPDPMIDGAHIGTYHTNTQKHVLDHIFPCPPSHIYSHSISTHPAYAHTTRTRLVLHALGRRRRAQPQQHGRGGHAAHQADLPTERASAQAGPRLFEPPQEPGRPQDFVAAAGQEPHPHGRLKK